MTDIEILPFDPLTAPAALWAGLHAFRRARHAESFPEEPLTGDAEYEAMEREPSRFGRRVAWMARAEGLTVGFAYSFLADPAVPELAEQAPYLSVGGGVVGPWRRRGIATRLLAQVHGFMLAHGKTMLTLSATEPDGHAFLQRLGAEERMRSVDNRLALDRVDWGMVERWHTAMRAAVPGLGEATYAGRVPAAVFEDLVPAFNIMIQDIPRDRCDHPVAPTSLEIVADWYRDLDVVKGEHHMVLLRDAAGAVAGFSDIVWRPDGPDRAYQVFTGVRRDLRGLGLGRGVKAALLRHVRAALPQVRLMLTGNAAVNAPMRAINTRLGYAVHKVEITYQIGVAVLGAALGVAVATPR